MVLSSSVKKKDPPTPPSGVSAAPAPVNAVLGAPTCAIKAVVPEPHVPTEKVTEFLVVATVPTACSSVKGAPKLPVSKVIVSSKTGVASPAKARLNGCIELIDRIPKINRENIEI